MQGEAFQEGAPGLLSGRGPHVHLRPAQPLLQGVRLVRLPRVLRPLRGQGPSFLQQAHYLDWRAQSRCVVELPVRDGRLDWANKVSPECDAYSS